MAQTIKSIQWNVGAGKFRLKDDDALVGGSYNLDDIDNVIEVLRLENPDIITLQEVHADDKRNQVEIIAQGLGYSYYVSDFYSESHLEYGQRLGQGIIARFPITNHKSRLFKNPLVKVIWKDGRAVTTHDNGVTSCIVEVGGVSLVVETLHLVPFDPFKIDLSSNVAKEVFSDVEDQLLDSSERLLIQGDLNLGHLNPRVREVMPRLSQAGIQELDLMAPTIPNGERPDRIMYRGLKVIDSKVSSSVLTDHYPVVATFQL